MEERRKQSWDSMFYSIQRIDLLIISIYSGGIYVCLETIKYLAGKQNECVCINENEPNYLLVKLSGVIFVVAIVLNFYSQRYGYKANQQDYLMCDAAIDLKKEGLNESDKHALETEIINYDNNSDKFSKYTDSLNDLSMYAMFIGLVLILIFFLITF